MKKFAFIGIAFLFFFTLTNVGSVFAGTGQNISGYAWSDTIGWISFNCTNDNSCGTVDYGVNKNPDGTLVGYAWSSNIGWIQFGGLSGFPSGTGTTASNAQVVGSTLQGWARAISQDGLGWDGWISLSGSTPTYGVSFSGTSFTGYAWGSNVVGWILFDIQNVYPSVCTSCGATVSGDVSIDIQSGGVSIVGNNAVAYNTVPTFVWTFTNVPGASCSVAKTSSGGTAFSTISGITTSGSTSGSALTGPTSYTYSIDCTNPTISHQASFTVASQPPGFSLGGTEGANIQFLASTTADSEQKTFFVSAFGGFNSPVSVDVTDSTCPASAKFSLGGGTFSTNPSPVSISSPYSAGSTFKVRLTQAITNACTITLTGTGGSTSATKNYVITPNNFKPKFEEY